MTTAGAKGQQQQLLAHSRKGKKNFHNVCRIDFAFFLFIFFSPSCIYQQHVYIERAPSPAIYPESDGEEWREVFILTLGANADLFPTSASRKKKKKLCLDKIHIRGSSRAVLRGYCIRYYVRI
jgi:hypothetical protein